MNNTVFPRIMLPYYPIFLSADFLLQPFLTTVFRKKKKNENNEKPRNLYQSHFLILEN